MCGIGSHNEIWTVDYQTQNEKKLVDTFTPVLSIKPFTDINKRLVNLFLVREKEWICILNVQTTFYARLVRIPYYVQEDKPSHNF